jgi:hypothetical protein
MPDDFLFADRTLVVHECPPVREVHPALDPDLAIAVLVEGARPRMASVWPSTPVYI